MNERVETGGVFSSCCVGTVAMPHRLCSGTALVSHSWDVKKNTWLTGFHEEEEKNETASPTVCIIDLSAPFWN